MDQKSFPASLSYHDESWSGVQEDPSDSPWRVPCSSPRSGRSRINKVDVLTSWSPPGNFTVPSAIGKKENFSPLMGVNTSFALIFRVDFRCVHLLQFLNVCDQMSPFQIPPTCNAHPRNTPAKTVGPNWCSRDRSLAEIGCSSTIAQNGIIGPLKGSPKRPSHGVFPSDKRSCMFRR